MSIDLKLHRVVSSGLGARLPALLALPLWFAAACGVEPAEDPPAGEALNHCVSNVDGDGTATCYATFTEAIAAATDGKITDAAADYRDAFTDGTLTDRINAIATERAAQIKANLLPPTPGSGGTVIGIVNHDAHNEGKDWVFRVSTLGCDGSHQGIEWAVQNLNEAPYTVSQMNDNISSFRSFSGCATVVFEDWKLNNENPGAIATVDFRPVVDLPYVGDEMNDKGSSIAWY